jgi:hypothetical protein
VSIPWPRFAYCPKPSRAKITGPGRFGLPPSKDSRFQGFRKSDSAGAADPGATGAKNASIYPDLQRVFDTRLTLPEPMKAGILAMVNTAAYR